MPPIAASAQQTFVTISDGHEGVGGFHPVAAEPASNPPASSIKVVTVERLATWIDYWAEYHWNKHETLYDPVDGALGAKCACCGESPFRAVETLVIRAVEHRFVTVGDYVTQVHAWLLTLKTDILRAMDGIEEDDEVVVENLTQRRLWLIPENLEEIWIADEAERRPEHGKAMGRHG